jgi:carboxymethylenebutenolidase
LGAFSYEGLLAETVTIQGQNGDDIEAYLARPLGVPSSPGVVVIHHMPGWDEATKEIARKFAHHGYTALSPHLFSREGPGSPDDLSAKVRAAGGNPDARVLGDLKGAVAYLRKLPYSNGKVGAIGFCSGGRQAYMAACRIPELDAAVDCWGGRVIPKPEELTPAQPAPVIDMTPDMSCPLLGIFGADDLSPSPEQVAQTEEVLKRHGKEYEFHMYEGAGHGFFATDRDSYRPAQAKDAWQKVFAFYAKHLGGPAE